MLDKHILRGDILEALAKSPAATEDLRLMMRVSFPADIAEIVSELDPPDQVLVMRLLPPEKAAETVSELPDEVQRDLILNLFTKREVAGILNEIDPDEGADLIGLLPEEEGEEALQQVEPEQAEAIRSLAEYDPETAGGRMTTEYVTVSPALTVAETLDTLRKELDNESITNVYVVDPGEALLGVMSVREILEALPTAYVSEVMTTEVISARADDDQEDASRLLDRYDLTSLPVVDERGGLVGVLTHDDAMDVLEEEAEEDIAYIAGSGVVSVRDPVLHHLRHRLPWLLITLVGGVCAALLVKWFKPTLDSIEALVFFMPLMAGMAGSVGIQSSTVMVRGFATGEMVMGMSAKTILHQTLVGVLTGAVCGSITGILAIVLTGDIAMGIAVTFSMLVGVAAAAGLGTLLPIVCERMDIDPAVSSGPFVTMANDLLGLLIYFAVASLLLVGTT
ncbi:MAG: magnesium transporter [Planctomycetota bacterium]